MSLGATRAESRPPDLIRFPPAKSADRRPLVDLRPSTAALEMSGRPSSGRINLLLPVCPLVGAVKGVAKQWDT